MPENGLRLWRAGQKANEHYPHMLYLDEAKDHPSLVAQIKDPPMIISPTPSKSFLLWNPRRFYLHLLMICIIIYFVWWLFVCICYCLHVCKYFYMDYVSYERIAVTRIHLWFLFIVFMVSYVIPFYTRAQNIFSDWLNKSFLRTLSTCEFPLLYPFYDFFSSQF